MLKLLKYELRGEKSYILILNLLIVALIIFLAFGLSFNKYPIYVFTISVFIVLFISWDSHLLISMVKFRNDINSKRAELTFTLPRSGI